MDEREIRSELIRIRARYVVEEGTFTNYRIDDREIWDLERKCHKSIRDIEKDIGIISRAKCGTDL